MRIVILGSGPKNKDDLGGQSVKTKALIDYLESNPRYSVSIIDTERIKKMPYRLFWVLFSALRRNDIFVMALAENGYKYVMPVIFLMNLFYHRRIIEIVIGGMRHEKLRRNYILRKIAKHNECIYMESPFMVKEYQKLGLYNCEYLPNFKTLKRVEKLDYEKYREKQLKVCTFSRIAEDKGIAMAVEAVKLANAMLGQEVFYLTIYGSIDEAYFSEFQKLKESFPPYINYGGIVGYDRSIDVLRRYSLILFPTQHVGEGFPGTIVDAYAAALPIITSDYGQIPYIFKDGQTGVIITDINIDKLAKKMVELYFDRDCLLRMAEKCLEESANYMTENVLKKLDERISSVK